MEELEARIEALERAVTEGDHDLSELAAEGETRERLAAVETELEDLTERVAELEAATQALRGYVGNVRAVNSDIEQRADAALAKAESLESAIVGDQSDHPGRGGSNTSDGAGTARSGADSSSSESGAPHTAGTTRAPDTDDTTAGRRRERSVGGQGGTAGSGGTPDGHGRCVTCGRPAQTGTDRSDDPLDGVFEADGHENGDPGTFDRIREML